MTNEQRIVQILDFLSQKPNGAKFLELSKELKLEYHSANNVMLRMVKKGLLSNRTGQYAITEMGKRSLQSISAEDGEEREKQKIENEKWVEEDAKMAMLDKEKTDFTDRVADYFKNGLEDDGKTVKSKFIEAARNNEVCELDWPSFDKFIGTASDLVFQEPKEAFRIMRSTIKNACEISCDKIKNNGHFLMFRNFKEAKSLYRQISKLRTEDEGKFVVLKGTITADNEISSFVYEVTYTCNACGWTNGAWEELSYPNKPKNLRKCPSCNAFGGVSRIEKKENRLLIVIEEEISETGNEPEAIPCVLQPHLCLPKYTEQFKAGQRIIFSGIIRERQTFKEREQDPLMNYKRWFDVISFDRDETDWAEITNTPEDILKIKSLAQLPDKDLKAVLINSFCPHLVNIDVAKEAAIISLVGGTVLRTAETIDDNGKILPSYEAKPIHLLFVGDPSTGKTDMFDFIEKIGPKVRRASGRGTTTAGLTASVVQNPETGRWGVQAGLMVLANKGILEIDEAGLIPKEELGVLRDAMQSCRIIISKAGKAEYKAETTVIMGKNPKYSRFDPSGDMREQIELDEALLSRFAFVIPFFDVPNEEKDRAIAQSVLGRRKKPDFITVLSPAFLKKFIAFVKLEVKEVSISEGIAKRVEDYYAHIRKLGLTSARTIISVYARNINSLRLAIQANARLHLRTEANEEDYNAAITLFNSYLNLAGLDPETGKIDMDRITGGFSSAKRSKYVRFSETFDSLAKDAPNSTIKVRSFKDELLKMGFDESEIDKYISECLQKGDWFSPRVDEIRRVV